MLSLGHPARQYNDWVPSQSPADRPPRPYVRTAAGAPLQSTQLLQENAALNSDFKIGDVLPLVAPRRRPACPIPGGEHHHHEPATALLAAHPASQPQPNHWQPVILDIELPLGPDVASSQRPGPASEPRASREAAAIAPGGSRGTNLQATTPTAPPGTQSPWLQAEPGSAGRGADARLGFISSTSSTSSTNHYLLDPEALIRVMVGASLPRPPSAAEADAAPPGGYCGGAAAPLPAVAGIEGVRLYDSPEELLRGLDRLLPDCTAPDTGTSSGSSGSSSRNGGVSGPGAAVGGGGAIAASGRARRAPASGGGHDIPLPQRQPPQPPLQNPPYDHQASGLLHSLLAAIAPSSPLDSLRRTPSYGMGSVTGDVRRREAAAAAAPETAASRAQAPPSSPLPSTPARQVRSRQSSAQGNHAAGASTTTTTTNNNNNTRSGDLAAISPLEATTFTPQGRTQPTATAAAAPAQAVVAAPLLGPTAFDVIARGPAAASLVCAAAGVAVPPWARGLLPPPAGPGLRLDPALEWALGVLSQRVSPSQPAGGDLRLANRTLAAHLGPRQRQVEGLRWRWQRRQLLSQQADAAAGAAAGSLRSGALGERGGEGAGPATGAGAAAGVIDSAGGTGSGGAGAGAGASSLSSSSSSSPSSSPSSSTAAAAAANTMAVSGVLPWPLLLPVVEAIGDRLDAAGALALLRGLTRQVSPAWRRRLPPRQQDHLAATVRALLVAAFRNPYDISPSAAAGLLAVMARLNVRNSAACRLLVERVLQPEPHRLRHCGTSPSPSPGSTESPNSSSPASGPRRSRPTGPSERGATSLERPACHVRLRWVMMALGSLARLRLDHKGLPHCGVARLFRCALLRGDELTPAGAAALLVFAARLSNFLPYSLIRRYRTLVLRPRRSQRRISLAVRRKAAGSCDRSGTRPTRGSSTAVATRGSSTAVANPSAAAPRIPRSSLLARMHGSQLAAALEALDSLYGRSLGAAAVQGSGAAGADGGVVGDDAVHGRTARGPNAAAARALWGSVGSLAATLASALTSRRLRQLRRQQACRLPLVLLRLGGSRWPAEPQLMSRVQALALCTRHMLPRCDAVDVMLMLAGLRRAVQAASTSPSSSSSEEDGAEAGATTVVTAAPPTATETRTTPVVAATAAESSSSPAPPTSSTSSTTAAASVSPSVQPAAAMTQPVPAAAAAGRPNAPSGVRRQRGARPSAVAAATTAAAVSATAVATTSAAAAAAATTCLYAELADDAVRRYLVVLPQASLRHTAAVLQSLGVLWSRHHDLLRAAPGSATTATTTTSRAFPTAATTTIAGVKTNASSAVTTTKAASATAIKAADPPSAAAGAAGSGAPGSASAMEMELRRRRLTDLVSERDFLLQQLDEHLTACLLRSSSSSFSGGGGGAGAARHAGGGAVRGRGGGDGGSGGGGAWGYGERSAKGGSHRRGELEAYERAKWAIMVLSAYRRLHHPPPPGLQAALEDVLLARAETLGSAGWAAVRRAYEGLRLQPGRQLSVAMVTFA